VGNSHLVGLEQRLVPRRRARIAGSQTFLSLNSRLESNKEEEVGGVRAPAIWWGLSSAWNSSISGART